MTTTTPLIPPIVNALEAETARKEAVAQKIQSIVDTYKRLGWHFVSPVETDHRNLPTIALWPDRWGVFTAHLNLKKSADEVEISHISLFHKNYLGYLNFAGHHLTPAEVQAIIRIVAGQVVEIETEAVEGAPVVDEQLERLLEVEAE